MNYTIIASFKFKVLNIICDTGKVIYLFCRKVNQIDLIQHNKTLGCSFDSAAKGFTMYTVFVYLPGKFPSANYDPVPVL